MACTGTSEGMTWYGLVEQSFDGPDMTVYAELDYLCRFESGSRRGRRT